MQFTVYAKSVLKTMFDEALDIKLSKMKKRMKAGLTHGVIKRKNAKRPTLYWDRSVFSKLADKGKLSMPLMCALDATRAFKEDPFLKSYFDNAIVPYGKAEPNRFAPTIKEINSHKERRKPPGGGNAEEDASVTY